MRIAPRSRNVGRTAVLVAAAVTAACGCGCLGGAAALGGRACSATAIAGARDEDGAVAVAEARLRAGAGEGEEVDTGAWAGAGAADDSDMSVLRALISPKGGKRASAGRVSVSAAHVSVGRRGLRTFVQVEQARLRKHGFLEKANPTRAPPPTQ